MTGTRICSSVCSSWFRYARFIWQTSRSRDVLDLVWKAKLAPGLRAKINAEDLPAKKKEKLLARLFKMERAVNVRLIKLVAAYEAREARRAATDGESDAKTSADG